MARNGHERRTITRMLEHMEVNRSGVLLVHSAFKDFHRDGYDAETVLDTLVDYMMPGTLLLPTMSWRFVRPATPLFDELATPSNTGILTELFRVKHAQRRSLHPTHSVAGRGVLADDILGEHQACITPCGEKSPFGKLADRGGFVVMLGVGMDCCTLVHHVEETIAPDLYCRPAEETERYTCRDRYGHEVEVLLRRHRFLPRDYWQFQDMLAVEGALCIFRCDNAICRGFSAQALRVKVQDVLHRLPSAIVAGPGQRYRMM
jgi:aminoglycoside 3-N-acetyltransferase